MFKNKKALKVGVCSLATLAMLGLSVPSVFALQTTLTATGTLTDANATTASGSDMSVTLSPGVALQVYTSDSAYALASHNESAAIDDRLVYGIASVYSGYYMRSADATATGTTWTASTSASSILTSTGTANFPLSAWSQQ